MSCSNGWEYSKEDIDGVCSVCGMHTVAGHAAYGCHDSPVVCDNCSWSPCDGSC